MELVELVPNMDELETREVYWTEQKRPTLNVVNTRLSISDVKVIREMVQSNVPEDQIAAKYNLTIKYLREILRGGRWGE